MQISVDRQSTTTPAAIDTPTTKAVLLEYTLITGLASGGGSGNGSGVGKGLKNGSLQLNTGLLISIKELSV